MDREDTITTAIEAVINAGELAGAGTLVWQNGEVIQTGAVGWRDIATGLPIERDTLFRIASMTKPITSMAALMLCEAGRFALSEPITRWAPEFSQMRVLRSPVGSLDHTDPAERPITFEDLLTHRSGLSYMSLQQGPIADDYQALGGDIGSPLTPDAWIAELATLPLVSQPGTAFHYGHSTDLLGLLIARIEEAPLGDVLERLIFRPLGMKDTGFTIPPEKRDRQAKMYGFDEAGRLTEHTIHPDYAMMLESPGTTTYVSGGGGLWSTLDDYLAFARMFVSEGTIDGVQLLRPETLARMVSNHLAARQRAEARLVGMSPFVEGHGFGLGVAVVLEPEKADPIRCCGGVGTVGWPGAWGGWWQADPNNHSVLIFLAHNFVNLDQLAQGIGLGVYDAISQFHTRATTLLYQAGN